MGYNVLIVDDSGTTRTIIAKALRHSGVSLGDVLFAADGLEALETLKDNWVDIVFADLNMPRLSGVEMVERMADSDLLSSVPVVIVSSEGRQDRIDALLSRGVAAYLRKPFPPEQVARIASQLLVDGVPTIVPGDDLDEAFFASLEGFAMLVAEPVNHHPSAPLRGVLTTMKASGLSVDVELAMATSVDGATAIAEAALGEESGSATDALGELLNIIAARLADTLAGGPFLFDVPVTTEGSGDAAWLKVCQMQQCRSYDIEGSPIGLGLAVRERW